MLIYTSDNSNYNNYLLSQTFIDDLNKNHFWTCLFYLPNANINVRKFFHRKISKSLFL